MMERFGDFSLTTSPKHRLHSRKYIIIGGVTKNCSGKPVRKSTLLPCLLPENNGTEEIKTTEEKGTGSLHEWEGTAAQGLLSEEEKENNANLMLEVPSLIQACKKEEAPQSLYVWWLFNSTAEGLCLSEGNIHSSLSTALNLWSLNTAYAKNSQSSVF